jgi:hypothetical protein
MRPTLQELAHPELSVTLRGRTYAVRPVDGYGMQVVSSVAEGDRLAMIRATYKIAARCIGLSFDEVFGTEDSPGFSDHGSRTVAGGEG